jgi:putative oxidoreductase
VRLVFLALLRFAIGLIFIATGVQKLRDRTASTADFSHWGLPAPSTAVLVISGLEVICGLLILLGLATRFGALLVCLDMLGAVATAGRIDGGVHLVVPPVLALLSLVLVARGGGRWQLLDRLDPPR